VIVRVRLLPREEWAVLIPDHHRGFITWTGGRITAGVARGQRPLEGCRNCSGRRVLLEGLLGSPEAGRHVCRGNMPLGVRGRYCASKGVRTKMGILRVVFFWYSA
jgi:hypothetical protein